MDKIDNPTTDITPRLIRTVMDEMAWPPIGKTQASVNKNALTSYNAVVRQFRKEAKTTNVIRNEVEAKEAIRVVLRRRLFNDN